MIFDLELWGKTILWAIAVRVHIVVIPYLLDEAARRRPKTTNIDPLVRLTTLTLFGRDNHVFALCANKA